MASSFLKKYGSLLAVAAALAIFWRFALPVILPLAWVRCSMRLSTAKSQMRMPITSSASRV